MNKRKSNLPVKNGRGVYYISWEDAHNAHNSFFWFGIWENIHKGVRVFE